MLLSDRALTPEEIASVATPDIALKDSGIAELSEADQPAGTTTTVSSDAGSTATGETSPTTTLANAATDDNSTNQGAQTGDDLLGLGAGDTGSGNDAGNTEQTTETPNSQQEGLTLTGSDGKPLTSDQVLRLPPNQKIELEDGTITDIQTLRASGYFKNEYDNKVRTLNQERQELEQLRQAASVVAPYATSIEQSQFAKAYLENYRLTGDESRALAAASAATGIALPQQVTQSAPQEPKRLTPEMDEYYEQDPAALGIEYATPEWDQFILKGSAALARLATRREHDRIAGENAAREAERRRAEEAQQAEVDRAQSIDNTILNRNKQVLQKMGEIYAEEQKINLSTLTVQQRTELMQSITETFRKNGMDILDDGYLKNNFLDETHLRFVAMRTPFSSVGASRTGTHTPAAPMVVPPSPTTATQSSQPVSAGGQSATIPDRVGGDAPRQTEGQMHRALMNQLLS